MLAPEGKLMASDKIFMSTTDTIPHYPDMRVTRSELTWCHSRESFVRAYYGIEDEAVKNGYGAIVGVRFVECAKPDGIEYWVYGTAVAFDY
jgi:hypothetical protein